MYKTCLTDLLEGDILLEDDSSSRASVNKQIYLWPGGIVPYVLDSRLSTCSFLCNLLLDSTLIPGILQGRLPNENIKVNIIVHVIV